MGGFGPPPQGGGFGGGGFQPPPQGFQQGPPPGAGEDETGTFRPAKAEPDAFGAVVTDDQPAGWAGTAKWVDGLDDGSCPEGYPIKGNASSRIYHLPGSSSYNQTHAELCFASEEDAAGAGYRPRAR